MLRRCLSGVLLLTVFSGSLSAQSLQNAIRRATVAAQPTSSLKPNPYKKPALGLMGAGGALLILGLSKNRGIEASTNATGTVATVNETGGSKTALEVLGVLTAGAGAFLYWRGEQARKHGALAPVIRMTKGRTVVGATFRY